MTIEEFIEARLAEDEFAARSAMRHPAEGPAEVWEDEYRGPYEPPAVVEPLIRDNPQLRGTGEVVMSQRNGAARHIARHDPARVLRQVAALRELFERAKPWPKCRGHPGPWMPHGDYGPGFCGTPEEADSLRVIAAIWSDHPDYRPEWNA